MKRVVVVGAGLSGLICATALARFGNSVICVVFGTGGLPLGPGLVDVFGYDDGPVTSPWQAVAVVGDGHPYRAIGEGATRRGLYLLRELAGPGLLMGDGDSNVILPTAAGFWRPTCLYPPSMAAGRQDVVKKMVVAGFSRLKDFHPSLIAGNLGEGARGVSIDVVPRPGELDPSGMVFARFFDTAVGRQSLVDALRPVVREGETIGLPAVVGLDDVEAWRKVQDDIGQPVFEIPLPPPSVAGWRLQRTLERAATQAGVRFWRGSRVSSVEMADGRATGIVLDSAGHQTLIEAEAVVVATGGLRSGGIVMDDQQTFREPVCGLPLVQVPEQPFVPQAGKQPAYLVGVRVDESMRPLDGDDALVCQNLYAIGGLLGGSIRWDQKTAQGIDIGSAIAAAEAIRTADSRVTKLVFSSIQYPHDGLKTQSRVTSLARESLDQCIKCTICEASCPVAAATPLFPGPKFVGPQAERFRAGKSVDHSLDYCSSCGTCTLVCPQGVKVAEINSQARAAMKAGHMPLRDQLISRTTLMGQVMTPIAPVANAVLNWSPARVIAEKTVGIHRRAPMPQARHQTFEAWFSRHQPTKPPTRGPVVFFHGCAGEYFEVETSKMAIQVLEHIGYQVLVPKHGCCGLALQSNGLYDEGRAGVLKLCDDLRAAGAGLTIVSASGSCTGMLKHEAREILGVDDARLRDVSGRIRDIMEFLRELDGDGRLPTDFAPIPMTVAYHAPCQLKSQGMGYPALDILGLIPELTVVESGLPCCGIAGTYGLKAEKYDIAQAVGKPLFDMVRSVNPSLALCDTETCRWQITQSSGVPTKHPIAMVHQAYGLGPKSD